jgi:hypothetical protein
MPRRQKNPLRSLTDEEHNELARLSRSRHSAVVVVSRAKTLLGVAAGLPYT